MDKLDFGEVRVQDLIEGPPAAIGLSDSLLTGVDLSMPLNDRIDLMAHRAHFETRTMGEKAQRAKGQRTRRDNVWADIRRRGVAVVLDEQRRVVYAAITGRR